MKFHNVYWIWAPEFEPIGYFGSREEAELYATDEWEGAITELAERNPEQQ